MYSARAWSGCIGALVLLWVQAVAGGPVDEPWMTRGEPVFTLGGNDVRVIADYHAHDPLRASSDDVDDYLGRRPWTLTLYWENDGGFFQPNHPRDRYYTNGMAATLTHQPQWADRIAPYMPFARWFGEPEQTGVGYVAGQRMYTPWDIEDPDLIEDDRPYAGYNFVGIYWQRARSNVLDHFQVNMGLVGPSTHADSIQTWAHDIVNARDTNGWEHQLHDEPVFQTYLRRKWRAMPHRMNDRDWPWDIQMDLIPAVGLALGTAHRHVEASLMLRAGWNLPNNFGLGRIDDPIAATHQPIERWNVYGFARTSMRLVEHNLFLAGNTWKDSHGVTEEPLVGDVQFGTAVSYRRSNWSFRFQYSQVFMTDEFKGQPGSDGYGAFVLSLTGWF